VAHAGFGRGINSYQASAFAGGMTAVLLALASPLDRWSETLLAAHMVQHELLVIVAAPLVAWSAPLIAVMWAFSAGWRRVVARAGSAVAPFWSGVRAPAVTWLLHAAALWVWRLPALYDAALSSQTVRAAEHLSFFGTAALFWWSLHNGRYGRLGYGAAVVYVFATALHSGVLGALLALSPHAWYPFYLLRSETWGLTPLEDQQLASVLMWVPAGIVFGAGGLFFFAAWLRESERRVRSNALLVVWLAALNIDAITMPARWFG
jgi:putative membrane protein